MMPTELWWICFAEGALLVFDISLALVVVVQIWRHRFPFTSLFYRLFACLTTVDCLNYMLVRLHQPEVNRFGVPPRDIVSSTVVQHLFITAAMASFSITIIFVTMKDAKFSIIAYHQ